MAPTALTVAVRSVRGAATGGINVRPKPKKQFKPSDEKQANDSRKLKDNDSGLVNSLTRTIIKKQQKNRAYKQLPVPPRGYKGLAVSPGKLGITLNFLVDRRGPVITAINPACSFKNDIEIGNRLICIDGRKITKPADLHVGKDKMRVFGFVGDFTRETTATATALEKVPAAAASTDNQAQVKIASSLAGKRKCGTGNNAKEVGKRKREKENDAQHDVTEAARKQAKTHHQQQLHRQQQQQFNALQFQVKQPLEQAEKQQQAAQYAADVAAQKQLLEFGEFEKWLNGWTKYQQFLTNHYRTRHADGWEQRYQELIRFKQANEGDCNSIPLDYRDPDDLALGEWAELQRELYYEGTLDEDRANCLTEQGFDFNFVLPKTSFTGDEHWDEKMKELVSMMFHFIRSRSHQFLFGGET